MPWVLLGLQSQWCVHAVDLMRKIGSCHPQEFVMVAGNDRLLVILVTLVCIRMCMRFFGYWFLLGNETELAPLSDCSTIYKH